MYSQISRPFSQGQILSQLTCPSSSQINSKNNEKDNSSSQKQQDLPQDYDMPLASEPEAPGEPLSSRADALCEVNRQIRTFVEGSIKQLEKRRIKLKNKINIKEDVGKITSETHSRQSHQSLDLQMNLEEWAENYQNELQPTPKIVQKQEHTQTVVGLFKQHYTKGITVGEEIRKGIQHFRSAFNETYAENKMIKEKYDEIKLSFISELKEIICQCQDLKLTIMTQKESSVHEIQTLALQYIENSNYITDTEQDIKYHMGNEEELTVTRNNLDMQNKTMSDEIVQLHEQLNELHVVSASQIQHLKLQLNNEENINANLKIKYQEKEHCLNNVSTKQKELMNLANQMKTAVEETTKCNEGHLKKIEEYQEQNTVLSNQIRILAESIKTYENVENENSCYKSSISELDESNRLSDIVLKEKECFVSNLKDKIEESNKTLSDHCNNISYLDEELKKCTLTHEEIASKLRVDKLKYQQERECKMLQNKTMEQSNKDLTSELDKMSKERDVLIDSGKTFQNKTKEIQDLIKKLNINAKENGEKLLFERNKWEDESTAFNEEIELIYEVIDEYEDMISGKELIHEELLGVMAMKNSIEQDLLTQDDKCRKEINTLKHNLSSKILEIDREIENHTSIMKRLIMAEEEATDRIKEDIRGTEKIKIKHEDDLRVLHQQLNVLKKDKDFKRNEVATLEKRLKKINKEIIVTREDIKDAITGNIKFQGPINKTTNHKRLTTPTSSLGSQKNLNEPPNKRMTFSKDLEFIPNVLSQINTKKWVESVPQDDYDFSEI